MAVVIVLVTALVFAVVVMIVIVVEAAARAIPITGIEASAIVARTDPARAFIRRTSPIASVPDVTAADRVPVAFDPTVFGFGAGADWTDCVDARWRWRSDLDADGNLAECRGSSNKNRAREQ